jgi:hypothetical protein
MFALKEAEKDSMAHPLNLYYAQVAALILSGP